MSSLLWHFSSERAEWGLCPPPPNFCSTGNKYNHPMPGSSAARHVPGKKMKFLFTLSITLWNSALVKPWSCKTGRCFQQDKNRLGCEELQSLGRWDCKGFSDRKPAEPRGDEWADTQSSSVGKFIWPCKCLDFQPAVYTLLGTKNKPPDTVKTFSGTWAWFKN